MTTRSVLVAALLLVPWQVTAKGLPRETTSQVLLAPRDGLPVGSELVLSRIDGGEPYLTAARLGAAATVCGIPLPAASVVRFAEEGSPGDAPDRGAPGGRTARVLPATDLVVDGTLLLEDREVTVRCADDLPRIVAGYLGEDVDHHGLVVPAGSRVSWARDGSISFRSGGWTRHHGIEITPYSWVTADADGRLRSIRLAGDGGELTIGGVTCTFDGVHLAIELHPNGAVHRCRLAESCQDVELDDDGEVLALAPRDHLAACDRSEARIGVRRWY
jgi:hypothetical protein